MSSTARRVDQLLAFLDADPANPRLLADAAAAALADRRHDLVLELAQRYAQTAAPPPALRNIAGLAALREGRHDAAAEQFAAALEGDDAPALRYNLACARCGLQDWAGALALLDDAVVAAQPAAARLKVQMLHQLGALEDALAWGGSLAERRPDDVGLMGALSAVAVDAGELALAQDYAERADDAPEGLATLGMLQLDRARLDTSDTLFDQALAADPACARARLGKGLVALARSDGRAALHDLDQAAAAFGDHLGAWIAAGWAHFAAGDRGRARQRFETAMALDDAFAEAHGALAVLDALEDRPEAARRGARTALGLDRNCLSAVLANSLLLDDAGNAAAADRLRQSALNAPIGPSGQTIAEMMKALAGRRR